MTEDQKIAIFGSVVMQLLGESEFNTLPMDDYANCMEEYTRSASDFFVVFSFVSDSSPSRRLGVLTSESTVDQVSSFFVFSAFDGFKFIVSYLSEYSKTIETPIDLFMTLVKLRTIERSNPVMSVPAVLSIFSRLELQSALSTEPTELRC